jgi:hypothetical protein
MADTKRPISPLTQAQIYVLHRLASGTQYEICGEFRRARECRMYRGHRMMCDAVAPRSSFGLGWLSWPIRPSGLYREVIIRSS